jgi:hypothetical protein
MSQINFATAASRTLQPNVEITAASDAAPIAVTTSAAHGLVTGDIVQVSGVTGNLAANGQWVVTKVDSTHFSLNNSIGSGAYSSGGNGVHLGFIIGAIAVDNTVFSTPPDFSLTARLESLSAASNIRIMFEDATDVNYLTAEPLTVIQFGPGSGGDDGELTFTKKRGEMPDTRIAISGATLRAKAYVSGGAFSSAELSAWLTY